jgi:selenide,water dikinase
MKWDAIRARVMSTDKKLRVGVVGGGAGGVELILSMQVRNTALCPLLSALCCSASHLPLPPQVRLKKDLEAQGKSADLVEYFILSSGKTVLPAHSPNAQKEFAAILAERNVQVEYGCKVVGAEASTEGRSKLVCVDGRYFECDECVWCTSAAAQVWLKDTGLELDSKGFIAVHSSLESRNSKGIFAAGDIAVCGVVWCGVV